MSNRRLLLVSIALLAGYIVIGQIIDNPYLSSASSLLLLVTGALSSVRYSPVAWDVLVNGERSDSPGEEGSHKAVYGMALLANGSVYVGVFGLLWVAMGQPSHWLGTWYSGLGRAIMAAGFWLMFISPDASRPQVGLPRTIWFVVMIAFALLAAFALGQRVGSGETQLGWQRSAMIAGCPPGRDVWGTRAKIYHAADSPYRPLILSPHGCFLNEDEARTQGYRAPAHSRF